MTAVSYIEKIIQDHVVLFVDVIGREDVLLMQELTSLPVAKIIWLPSESENFNDLQAVQI